MIGMAHDHSVENQFALGSNSGVDNLSSNAHSAAMLQNSLVSGMAGPNGNAVVQSQNDASQHQQMSNLSNEIKRLQQFQQQMGVTGAPNALLMPAPQLQSQQLLSGTGTTESSLMTISDKLTNSRLDNPLAQTMGATQANPMLQPAFFQDPRFFMTASFPVTQQQQQQQAQQQQIAVLPNVLRAGELPLPSPHSLFHRDGTRRMRGGVIEPFPEKLHRLLLEVEAAGRSDVISFVANGRAFAIHKPDKFFKEIVPLYFRQSRLSSFKRQLNLYGFELINTGPARGGYFHDLFVKERPELCRRMRRVAVKINPKKGDNDDPTGGHEKGDDHRHKEESEYD